MADYTTPDDITNALGDLDDRRYLAAGVAVARVLQKIPTDDAREKAAAHLLALQDSLTAIVREYERHLTAAEQRAFVSGMTQARTELGKELLGAALEEPPAITH